MMGKLSVERLASPAELIALDADCARLTLSMRPRVPFATNSWLTLWWQHYREERLLVRDQFYVHAVRDEQRALLAIAPLVLTERPGNGPWRSRNVSFFGGDKNVTELRGLICAPEHEAAVVRSLLSHFDRRSGEWDWFAWNGVRRGTEAHSVLDRTDNFHWCRETTDYMLPLPATWEEFRASRSRNIKESLRKCYNSLKRAGHDFGFRVAQAPFELRAAIERFFALHKRRASAPHLVHHPDVFAVPQARKLLIDLSLAANAVSSLHVFELEIAGRVVASRIGFLLEDELYLYFSGYEPEWAGYSVMTTAVAETIKWAIARGCRLVNLSPGTDVSKTRWGASPLTICEGVLLSRTRRGKFAFEVQNSLRVRSQQGTLFGRVMNLARRHG
jgi:CelD/BcsL family acetyltransferase involved in cellulose biosynthesis